MAYWPPCRGAPLCIPANPHTVLAYAACVIAADVVTHLNRMNSCMMQVVEGVLQVGYGGLVAVDKAGNITMTYNCEGMYRGCADSRGRFEVALFNDVADA
jgi:isoaspartyl peptidase/L-asparaginase-like protein (Ntn-hydrolase superfamily)